MKQAAIGFRSKKLSLEGIVATPDGLAGPYPALLVCHPHPMLGGNMDNPVVTAICRAAGAQGMASLRFNYRGVGGSQGIFSNGKGEGDDVRAALSILRRWPGMDGKRLVLVGYSFGAAVVLDGLRHYKAAHSLVLIAPPISAVRGSRIRLDQRPKLFVAGQHDRIASSVELQSALDDIRPPLDFSEIADADHSLRGHEEQVAERVLSFATASMAE